MNRFSKIIILSILFLIFTTYLPNTNTNSKSIFFPVKKILIETIILLNQVRSLKTYNF